MVDSNDISHASDYTHVHGSYDVVRNNSFHDTASTDFGNVGSGTVSVTNGSTTVNWVSGTTFSSGWAGGNVYEMTISGYAYSINSVTNSTTLVLKTAFSGTTGTYPYAVASTIHLDGMQTWEVTGTPLIHILIERNRMWNTPEDNTHFALLQDETPTLDHPSDAITRYNAYYGCGSYFTMSDGIPNSRVYNNTIANGVLQPGYISSWTSRQGVGATGGVWLNNIIYQLGR